MLFICLDPHMDKRGTFHQWRLPQAVLTYCIGMFERPVAFAVGRLRSLCRVPSQTDPTCHLRGWEVANDEACEANSAQYIPFLQEIKQIFAEDLFRPFRAWGFFCHPIQGALPLAIPSHAFSVKNAPLLTRGLPPRSSLHKNKNGSLTKSA